MTSLPTNTSAVVSNLEEDRYALPVLPSSSSEKNVQRKEQEIEKKQRSRANSFSGKRESEGSPILPLQREVTTGGSLGGAHATAGGRRNTTNTTAVDTPHNSAAASPLARETNSSGGGARSGNDTETKVTLSQPPKKSGKNELGGDIANSTNNSNTRENIRRINVLDPDSHTNTKKKKKKESRNNSNVNGSFAAYDYTDQDPFADNCIKTTKYTINPLSRHFFLWKNLFEQFQRKANLYFLVIGCLQLIPGVSPTGQFTTLLTLLAVIVFSMIKAGYEDYLRFLKDVEVNGKTAYVLRITAVEGAAATTVKAAEQRLVPRFVPVKYTDVRVGDIIRVLNLDPAELLKATTVNGNGGGDGDTNTSSNTNNAPSQQPPHRNNALPCDIMLLASSDLAEGVAYVETSNLDGETNLKPRFCVEKLKLNTIMGKERAATLMYESDVEGKEGVGGVKGLPLILYSPVDNAAEVLEEEEGAVGVSDPPSVFGSVEYHSSSRVPTTRAKQENNNNTSNNIPTNGGEVGDDNDDDADVRMFTATAVSQTKTAGLAPPLPHVLSPMAGDPPNPPSHNHVTTGSASQRQQQQQHQDRISTAMQCWQAFNGCRIECEEPNGHLYTFTGTFIAQDGERHAITPNQMLYRGTNLRKVSWAVGAVVYTGSETKVMKNARSPPHKSSHVESLVNWLLIAVLLLQFVLVLLCAIIITVAPEEDGEWYLGRESQHAGLTFILGFVTFAILFNNLIPISLYVSMEMIKFMQGRLMEWDLCMYYQPRDLRATAKTTDLNEELGQINYIFSDKTGTLTCNEMAFMKFFCGGEVYGTGITEIGRAAAMRRGVHVVDTRPEEVIKSDFPFYDGRISDEKWWTHPNADAFRELFTILAVCHTVVIDQGKYEAESPDEEALVKAANAFGIKFASRTSETVKLEIGVSALVEEITILDVIPFDSDRKRMSVLVKMSTAGPSAYISPISSPSSPTPAAAAAPPSPSPASSSQFVYKLLTKGADNVMLERIERTRTHSASSSFTNENETRAALQQFGEEGLRVLVLASRDIPEETALQWSAAYRSARSIIGEDVRREELLAGLAAEIERDLQFVGVTGIEDKLQEGVPQAMESFRDGGIKVWMLTGDKVETAINIGHACSLLFSDSRVSTFFGPIASGEEEKQLAARFEAETSNNSGVNMDDGDENMKKEQQKRQHSVVIDGDTLAAVLASEDLMEAFYQMVRHCVSVICCRVSPRQKALVVGLIRRKEASTCVSLAVGDGANDVPMIQTAHVGVGISGMEGQQAANAADYSVGQFKHLQRLLMVHGRVNYHRLSLTINYFFYKNALLVMTQFWFCIFNRFTGQSLYEKWTLSCYNLVFTALPIIVVGSLDRDILNTDNILALPRLYQPGLRSDYLNVRLFIRWLANAVVHSAVLFFVLMFGWGGDGVNNKGTTGGLDTTGLVLMSALVTVVNCKLALHANSFSWVQHLFIWGTILFFYFFCAIIGALPRSFSTTMYGNVQNILTFVTPWLVFLIAVALALLPDFFLMYGGYNFLKKTVRMVVQYADSKDPMASTRPPAELRRKKIPAAGASVFTTYKALLLINNAITNNPNVNEQHGASRPEQEGLGNGLGTSILPTSDPLHTSDSLVVSKSRGEIAAHTTQQLTHQNRDAKQALFHKSVRDEDDEIDVSQGIFMGFIDTDIEDEFLVGYYGTGFRYKFALGMCAVATLALLAVSIYAMDDGKYVEPIMWGISSVVCWVGFLVVFFVKSLDLRGPLHPIILGLTVVMFSSLSVANLLASQRDAKTHPVTMATILLGLITVLRPPFFHGLQYSLVAIVSFVGFSFAVQVDEWSNIDIAVRAVEIFVVVITAMIALVMTESFSRKMFISQLQANIASKAARREERRSLVLLGNVLPSAIVFEVRTNNHKLNQFSLKYDLASTLNSDIVKFTHFSSTKEPHVVVEMLNKMFTLFDAEAKLLGLEKIKTVGDAYICAGGVPIRDPLHQEKILFMGLRMIENIKELNSQGLTTLRDLNIQIRVGVATGTVSAGVVGMQKVCYEVFGECAEKSELMEQTGLPSRVHAHPDIVNNATRSVFAFDVVDGEYFVAGFLSSVNPVLIFFGGAEQLTAASHGNDELAPKGLPPALKSHMQLNRTDIYSFLEDEDMERRTTIRLWGNFQGEMQTGFLNFKNDLAETEYRHYARLLSTGRFTPEVAQGTYLFCATTLLFALYFESVAKPLTLVCLIVGAVHLFILVLYVVYSFLRSRRRRGSGHRDGGGTISGHGTTSHSHGGGGTSSALHHSHGPPSSSTAPHQPPNNQNSTTSDEEDGANAMLMIQRLSRKPRRSTMGGGGRPASRAAAAAPLTDQSQHVTSTTATRTTARTHTTSESNTQGNATQAGVDTKNEDDGQLVAHSNESFNADLLAKDTNGPDDTLPLCTPLRFFALISGTAALTVPVVAFFVFDNVSVVNVFVILSAMCYVLTMLHVRIPFKFCLAVAHLAVVIGSFFYATVVNDGSFAFEKDGGNLAALICCYLLTFISAYVMEQNVRKTFAAAKNLLYQNAETASSIALCDKILNNVLPRSIVKRMKDFPDRQIVDEVPDASVLFVYTDGLKHEHHAHKRAAQERLTRSTNSAANNVSGGITSMTGANTGGYGEEDEYAGASAGNAPEVIDSMNTFLWILDAITVKYGVEKIKTAPFLVVSGCPERRADHPERLAMVAMEIVAAVRQFNHDTGSDFKIKIGIHSGRVTAGVLGSTKFLYDVFGDTVNFASRLTSSAEWGTIQVSSETADRLQAKGYKIESKGTIELKGKGHQQVFLLKGKRMLKGGGNSKFTAAANAIMLASTRSKATQQVAGPFSSSMRSSMQMSTRAPTVGEGGGGAMSPTGTNMFASSAATPGAASLPSQQQRQLQQYPDDEGTPALGFVVSQANPDYNCNHANNNNNANLIRENAAEGHPLMISSDEQHLHAQMMAGMGEGAHSSVFSKMGDFAPVSNMQSRDYSGPTVGEDEEDYDGEGDGVEKGYRRQEEDEDENEEDMMPITNIPTIHDLKRTLQAKRNRELAAEARTPSLGNPTPHQAGLGLLGSSGNQPSNLVAVNLTNGSTARGGKSPEIFDT